MAVTTMRYEACRVTLKMQAATIAQLREDQARFVVFYEAIKSASRYNINAARIDLQDSGALDRARAQGGE